MKVNYPIINSLLQDDLYKFTMAQLVFHDFPEAETEWEFILRGDTQFPEGFGSELQNQVNYLSLLYLRPNEFEYLLTLPYFRRTYIEWLNGFRMNPDEVSISQEGGKLKITVKGLWYRVIFWEVKLMALISELYFILTGQKPDDEYQKRIVEKAYQLEKAGCEWSDFGTRRRFSGEVQSKVVRYMSQYKGFLGTSNMYLAMTNSVPVTGTSAHEGQMAMMAKYGVQMCNSMWLKHWSDFYKGQLGIALTDTVTTDIFLRDFNGDMARMFDGVRQDSYDEYVWGDMKMLPHYKKLGIDTRQKKFIFSNGLNVPKYIKIHNHFKDRCRPIAGIGTDFTNDCGVSPLNMVIKMKRANFGQGWVDVVKLSDSPGKHTGLPEAIAQAKRELRID